MKRLSILRYFMLRRLSGRIFWSFVGLSACMLATGLTAYMLLGQADVTNQKQISQQHQADSLNDWKTALLQENNTLDLIINNQLPDGLPFFQTSRGPTAQLLNDISKYFPNNNEATTAFRNQLNRYNEISNLINESINLTKTPAEQRRILLMIKNRLEPLSSQIELLRLERLNASQVSGHNYSDLINGSQQIYLLIAIFLFLLAGWLANIIARTATQPLLDLDERLHRIADGDLSEPLELRGALEVVELSAIFNRTIGDLQRIISSIQQQAKAVKYASQQVRQLSQGQANSVSEQAVAISQVSSTLVELSDTSRQIAGSASLVVETARQSLNIATMGYNTMQSAGDTMQEIRTKVNEIVESILALNALTQHIQEITVLMDTLSSEMHLLALNASIESVGAGTEGERFAVVAGHIRKLVHRSRLEGIEIQQLIQQIQRGAVGSVMVTEEGLKIVSVAEKTVQEGFAVNREIIDQAKQTTELAVSISLATEQQRVVSSQVAITLQQLSNLFSQISQTSRQYLISAEELGEVVNQLNDLSEMFVVEKYLAAPSPV